MDREALLLYALEQYERGDVCAQESLRPIKDQLADAVATCLDAALYEERLRSGRLVGFLWLLGLDSMYICVTLFAVIYTYIVIGQGKGL